MLLPNNMPFEGRSPEKRTFLIPAKRKSQAAPFVVSGTAWLHYDMLDLYNRNGTRQT